MEQNMLSPMNVFWLKYPAGIYLLFGVKNGYLVWVEWFVIRDGSVLSQIPQCIDQININEEIQFLASMGYPLHRARTIPVVIQDELMKQAA